MGKRKSIAKATESPVEASIVESPSKGVNNTQTPKLQKNAFNIQSAHKKDTIKENSKRKSLSSKIMNGDEISPKKGKIEPFSGTSDVFTKIKKEEPDPLKKNNVKSNKNANTMNTNSTDTKVIGDREKRRQEKIKRIRITSKERFKKSLSDAASGDEAAISHVKAQIAKLLERTTLSRSGKRRLKTLRKAVGDKSPMTQKQNEQKREQVIQKNENLKNKRQANLEKNVEETKRKLKLPQQKVDIEKTGSGDEDSEDSDEDNIESLEEREFLEEESEEVEEDDTNERDDDNESNENEGGESNENEGDESNDNDDLENEDSNSSNVQDSDNENNSSAEEGEDGDDNKSKAKTQILNKQMQLHDKKKIKDAVADTPDSKSRYVLFVGNLPYNVTEEDITKHFLKVGQVKSIRIPLDKQTHKPRGFAFVEVFNQSSYEKALSLHHTSISGRKINVMYTQGGKNNSVDRKQNIKAKNFKLQAMAKQGKLAGNVKQSQKRSFRRAKQQNLNKKQ